MDIETVIHKTIMWCLASLVLTAPFLLAFYLTRNWAMSLSPTMSVGFFGAALIVFAFYARLVQPKVDHFFQRRRWDLSRVLERFNDELVHLKDLDQLVSHIVSTVNTVLYVSSVSLLVRYENSDTFTFATKLKKKIPLFDVQNEFLKWLGENDAIVFRDYIDVDARLKGVSSQAAAYFEGLGVELCVPLVVNEKLIGILNLGAKQNLKRFRFPEIAFLSDLRRSASIALSNSLHLVAMHENLKRWNEELEQKVIDRTIELVETQQQLVQAEKLATLGTLAGGVAHEINNPLTAVLTNVQILKMDAQSEDLESLNLIEDGAKRCRAIVQKMMKYARKSEGIEAVEKVDVNKAVHNVVQFLKYQFEQDNVALIIETAADSGVVLGNMNELEQVLTNLLLNAKDATHEIKQEKKVCVRTAVEGDGAVTFTVSDNGVGISKENLSRIFDPFFTTKEVGKGTGLGLAVTQSIVQKFGGRIEAASEPGKGATFTVRFSKKAK
jgi:signal transduction histidine kinase